jgi:tRNA nucleotidyltransferase (CCA-adding enzyme)
MLERLSKIESEAPKVKTTPEALCNFFKEKGFIKEARLYNDPRNLGIDKIKIENLPKEIKDDMAFFVSALSAPILIDDIDNRTINSQGEKSASHRARQAIKDAIFSYNPKALEFYTSNKLRSSQISGVLAYADTLRQNEILSDYTIDQMKKLRKEINGTDDEKDFGPIKYQVELDNQQKLEVVEEYEKFLENVILDISNSVSDDVKMAA